MRKTETRLFTALIVMTLLVSMVGLASGHEDTEPYLVQVQTDVTIAARFAPVFYQGLGDKPRSDYITNFDFDGDWRGDNNWENAGDVKFPLKAYIYYAVSETETHYFIHYAVFHPRDYKGGEKAGLFLSELIREGAKRSGDGKKGELNDLMAEATVAHENDMEGALVVVAKNGKDPAAARVAYVETLAHNSFKAYRAAETPGFGRVKIDDGRPVLYVEPKGHGIEAYQADEHDKAGRQQLVYRYSGTADDPDKRKEGPIGYALQSIETTLWPKARIGTTAKGTTFGSAHDYSLVSIDVLQATGKSVVRKIKVGGVGSAFLGDSGGINMARPPWGWFDNKRRGDPLGIWFFNPAVIVKRDFKLGEGFSTTYVRLPFWAGK